jgi:hypothetical protein
MSDLASEELKKKEKILEGMRDLSRLMAKEWADRQIPVKSKEYYDLLCECMPVGK